MKREKKWILSISADRTHHIPAHKVLETSEKEIASIASSQSGGLAGKQSHPDLHTVHARFAEYHLLPSKQRGPPADLLYVLILASMRLIRVYSNSVRPRRTTLISQVL